MKNILVLGGGSERNRAWVDSCVAFLESKRETPDYIYYDHWQTGEKNVDFAVEIEKIKFLIQSKDNDLEWVVFAKSVGSIVTLKAVAAGVLSPSKCVFFGMPLNIAEGILSGDWAILQNFKAPALAFHNDEDPTADYLFTKNIIEKNSPQITLDTRSGNNHDYLDFYDYEAAIDNFLK